MTLEDPNGEDDDSTLYKVNVGMEVSGEILIEAQSEENARVLARRHIKREPFNGTRIDRCYTDGVWEYE